MPHRFLPALRFASLLSLAFVSTTFWIGCSDKQAASEGGSGGSQPARLTAIVLAPSAPASAGSTVPGNVLAEQQVEVQAEISGKVVQIGFREGEPVKAGQLLVRLDDAELKARADQASARLLLARTREKRLKQDFKAQAVSRGEYDQVHAEWKSAEAEAALAKAQWEKTHVRAPFDGVVGLREIELGSVVQPGTRLTTLQNLASLRVEFSVAERLAGLVRPGLKVRFTASGTPDTLEATVYAVESRVDADTRLLRVRARTAGAARGASGQSGRVLPGSFARVELPLGQSEALRVPTQAVVQSAQGAQVWRVRGGVAELVTFEPGVREARMVEALSGLSRGDTILVSGLLQLRPGTPVAPQVAAPAGSTPAAPAASEAAPARPATSVTSGKAQGDAAPATSSRPSSDRGR